MFSRVFFGSLAVAATLLSQQCAAKFPFGGYQLETVNNWGDNPTGLEMQIYKPGNVAEKPAVIFALHFCFGSGSLYNDLNNYSEQADEHGFIVVFPSSLHENGCWDVSSNTSLTRFGGGDSTGLFNMVKFAISEYGADPAQIFVTGSSSGCMMTNVMIALYPDLFAAATCYSGVAAGCLAGSPSSSPIFSDPACANGNVNKTGEQWAQIVYNMDPGYKGHRPKFATLHGTADTVVSPSNLDQEIKQWSTVFGIKQTASNPNTPQQGYTQLVFGTGTQFVAYSAAGVGHTVPVNTTLDLEWFGITSNAA
ncbi:uncharacterized protein TRUGW13939_00780 [Talaromyces rugulosus]|uniref:Carboxylic ester hydrolase n=1 Tax=Talaromyces rugulosus TaxID=121627 RepID=A0A7H8QIG9_TALRU|nr:uncharacterized protein TRUGW13939_00780 [Talaromyces rugulosus]QKX53700.1 hypothetical protein TRUGW13939_00780 [Talaromyces rugulosus]